MKHLTAAIADDSLLVREKLVEKIQKLPDVDIIWQAGNAFEAIREFRELQPDVFITDIQMPGMTGIEMLKELKAEENTKTTFIVLTNYPLPILKKRSIDAGAKYFFDKTTEFDKVIVVLREIKANL